MASFDVKTHSRLPEHEVAIRNPAVVLARASQALMNGRLAPSVLADRISLEGQIEFSVYYSIPHEYSNHRWVGNMRFKGST